MELKIRKYRHIDHKRVMQLHIEGLKQHNASIGDPSLDIDLQNILTTYIENSAKEKGYGRIILDTTINQEPAILLFKKNGYQEYNRKQIGDLNLVFFEKELKDDNSQRNPGN